MADKNTMLHISPADMIPVCKAYCPELPAPENEQMAGIRKRMKIANSVLGALVSGTAILYMAGVSFLNQMSKPAYASRFGKEPAAAHAQYTGKCGGALDSMEEMMESTDSQDAGMESDARLNFIIDIKSLYPHCEEEIDAFLRQNQQ